jgi:integrase
LAGFHPPAHKISEPAQIDLDLLNFEQYQKREGRSEETIHSRLQQLRQVARTCGINEPETVKTWLADSKNENNFPKPCTWQNRTKTKFTETYSTYLKFKGITWNPPKYTIKQKLPFIPTEQEIDQLIAYSGRILAPILQTLKETGMRIGELTQLLPQDLDTQRKTLAKKLNNPRLQQISFHTLRHWKGTTEYHKTKDIMHVRTVLGHKCITCTLIYINLESALFLQTDEDFICKIAHNEKEEVQLIEAGFTHVNNRDGLAFYKKRK